MYLENYEALTPALLREWKLARMWGRIADVIVLAVAAAIALFAIVAVSNSHPSGQYRSTLGDSPTWTQGRPLVSQTRD